MRLLGRRMTNDVRVSAPGSAEHGDGRSTTRRAPVRWLVVVGAVLIVTIAAGTAMTVNNFRQRTIDNSNRELENTVLLLSRHFDQQFQDLQRIQKSLTAHLLANGVMSVHSFASSMSSYGIHMMLKSKVDDVMSSTTSPFSMPKAVWSTGQEPGLDRIWCWPTANISRNSNRRPSPRTKRSCSPS